MTVRVCASVTACTSGILPRSPRVDVALTPSVRTLARTVPSSLAAAAVSRRSTFGSEMGRSAHGSEAGLAEVGGSFELTAARASPHANKAIPIAAPAQGSDHRLGAIGVPHCPLHWPPSPTGRLP